MARERYTMLTAEVDRNEHRAARELAELTDRPVAYWVRVLLRRELAAVRRDRSRQLVLFPADTSGTPT